MIKISEFNPIKSGAPVRKRGAVSGSSFADALDAASASAAENAQATHDVVATTALSNLLALQEISEEDIQRRKLVQQGNNLLDSLEDLRRQLLIGAVPMSTLRDLGRQLSVEKQFVTEPRLNELIEDIELRAAVELAKLEMAAKARD